MATRTMKGKKTNRDSSRIGRKGGRRVKNKKKGRKLTGKSNLRNICRYGVPGYDPFKTAGDCWFDERAAKNAVDFFPACLSHTKSSINTKRGDPFELDVWEKAVIGNMFGWKRKDGSRRYREAFIFVPRKNGKTTLTAGINLLLLFGDDETGAEIYCVAGEEKQAGIAFGMAKDMVAFDNDLSEKCQTYKNSIEIDWLGSVMRPVTAEADTKYGYGAHGLCVDELHIVQRETVEAWRTSTAARRQPMIVYLTTAGKETDTVCYEIYEYAKQVRDGVLEDESFFPVIFEAGDEDDWTNERVWEKANPGIDKSVNREYLRSEVKKAIKQPSNEAPFRRLHLNQWVSAERKWISSVGWAACGLKYTEEDLEGGLCFGGLDLSSNKDLTSFGLVFPREDDSFWSLSFNFLPKGQLQNCIKRDRVPYDVWAKSGWLLLTEGDAVDYKQVKAFIIKLSNRFNIKLIGADRWQANTTIKDLSDEGLDVEPFGQGYKSFSVPSKDFERRVIEKKIHHNRNPVLRWTVNNVIVERDAADNIKPNKRKAKKRIDPVVSLIMAIGCYYKSPGDSLYEGRGLTAIGG